MGVLVDEEAAISGVPKLYEVHPLRRVTFCHPATTTLALSCAPFASYGLLAEMSCYADTEIAQRVVAQRAIAQRVLTWLTQSFGHGDSAV